MSDKGLEIIDETMDEDLQKSLRHVNHLLKRLPNLREDRYYGFDMEYCTVELADLEEAMELAELTERQKHIIELVYGQGKSQLTVANELGVIRQTVDKQLKRSKLKLAEVYLDLYAYGKEYE